MTRITSGPKPETLLLKIQELEAKHLHTQEILRGQQTMIEMIGNAVSNMVQVLIEHGMMPEPPSEEAESAESDEEKMQ